MALDAQAKGAIVLWLVIIPASVALGLSTAWGIILSIAWLIQPLVH
jgi:hypothetical protein